MNDNFQEIIGALPFLIPLFLLELGLLVAAVVNIATRKRVRGGNKALWIILVVVVSVIGPIIYFAFGRQEDIVDSDKD
jgi:hypothetical protein